MTILADTVLERAELTLAGEDLLRRWRSLANDPESPDYFELNEFGELIMAPRPAVGHQRVASYIAWSLRSQSGGEAVVDASTLTDRGVRCPDVIWMPSERWAACKGQHPLEVVPDVCVEVLSPGNTREEIAMKVRAYLRGGAREVIVVGLNGEVEYFGPRASAREVCSASCSSCRASSFSAFSVGGRPYCYASCGKGSLRDGSHVDSIP